MTLLRVVSFNSNSINISNLSVSFSNSAICDSIAAETRTTSSDSLSALSFTELEKLFPFTTDFSSTLHI